MALETKCQTPETIFETNIVANEIFIKIILPKKLNLNEEEAELLDKNLHNALELVLARYF